MAVDKLYLFYATVFYKGMAMWTPEWEPTLRYPRRWNHRAKTPRVCVQLPMFNETFVARRVIDHACCMEYPKHQLYIQILDDSTDAATYFSATATQPRFLRNADPSYAPGSQARGS